MFSKYHHRGFEVVAFPCNQFGAQEPGTPAEIKAFAASQRFPGMVMEKIDVNGPAQDAVWKFMKQEAGGGPIRWNFEKFLIARDGTVKKRYGSEFNEPLISADIEAQLQAPMARL